VVLVSLALGQIGLMLAPQVRTAFVAGLLLSTRQTAAPAVRC
jgi:hypothetical protein